MELCIAPGVGAADRCKASIAVGVVAVLTCPGDLRAASRAHNTRGFLHCHDRCQSPSGNQFDQPPAIGPRLAGSKNAVHTRLSSPSAKTWLPRVTLLTAEIGVPAEVSGRRRRTPRIAPWHYRRSANAGNATLGARCRLPDNASGRALFGRWLLLRPRMLRLLTGGLRGANGLDLVPMMSYVDPGQFRLFRSMRGGRNRPHEEQRGTGHGSNRRYESRDAGWSHVGPGRPEEDTRGGFTQGGWGHRSASPDDACGKAMGRRMAAGGGLTGWLFGRRTYEGLLSYWNQQPDNPFAPALNNTPKYVVSTRLAEPLPWPNSTLVRGDVADVVGRLREQSNGVLAIMGSGQLIGSLMAADLIDEYLLMIHPWCSAADGGCSRKTQAHRCG